MSQYLTPSRFGVPSVPGVPETLKGTDVVAFRSGTQTKDKRNTSCSRRRGVPGKWVVPTIDVYHPQFT